MATDVARLALQIDVTGAQRARSAMEALRSGSIQLTKATDAQIAAQYRLNSSYQAAAASGRRLTGAFRLQKGAIQQVGFQVGDFATQVSAGQSAIVAFGQQASQLAGIMGPGGALLGAVIAIGAGIAGAFVRGMGEGEEATKSLREQIDELNISYSDLTKNQREALELERQRNAQQVDKRIASQREELEELRKTEENLLRLQRMAAKDPDLADVFNEEDLVETQNEITNLAAKIETAQQKAKQSKKEFDKMLSGIDSDDANEEILNLTETLQFQIDTFGASERAVQLAKIQQLAKNGADAEAVQLARQLTNELFNRKKAEEELIQLRASTQISAADDPLLQRVGAQDRGQGIIAEIRSRAEAVREGLDEEFSIRQAHKERVMALDDALRLGVINSVEERNRLEVESMRQRNEQLRQIEEQKYQILNSGQEAFLNATSNLFGNLASIAEKGGKDQFDTWKAMASAQAAVSTALAVANALTAAPPPINFALAASVGALGAVQIAQIQQQEYQGSYLGGGYTGTGSRTGGVDGKGGFPAILHPNETVIDHERAGAPSNSTSNVNQTLVFQVSGDASGDVKRQILAAAPLMREQAKQAVLQAINSGGPMAKAVGRRT